MICSPNIIRVITLKIMRYEGHAARVEERRNAYRVSVGKREGKRSLVIHRRRWEDNIKMGLQEVGRGHGLD